MLHKSTFCRFLIGTRFSVRKVIQRKKKITHHSIHFSLSSKSNNVKGELFNFVVTVIDDFPINKYRLISL